MPDSASASSRDATAGVPLTERAPGSAPPSSDAARGARLREVAATVYWAVVAAGAVLAVVVMPSAVASMASADAGLLILGALALAADVRPVRLPAPARRSMTFVVSVCFCFVILLLYGAAPAILVEIVAVGTAARRLHLNLRSWAYLTARLVCSFAVAGVVARALHVSAAGVRTPLNLIGVADLALVALTFVAVSCLINLTGAVVARATRKEIVAQLRFEVVARGSVVVLGVVIATTPSTWSLLLLFVPVLGWSQLSRVLADRDRRLEHDPVTGLLSQHGLAMEVANLPREHDRENDWFGVILVQLRGMAYVSRNVGRSAAEQVMRVAAQRLRDAGRPGDRIARLSESQFVVLRSDLWNESVMDGARSVVRALSAPVESQEGIPFRVDPVAGVAVAPQDGHDLRPTGAARRGCIVRRHGPWQGPCRLHARVTV